MNFIPETPFSWVPPLVAGLTALGVAVIAAVSLKLSDERKKNQEDRRRWDEELMSTVVKMLVLTDDVASTEKQFRRKKKAILAGDLPRELNQNLIHIRLLSNEHLADQAQEVVRHFLGERLAMHKFLSQEVQAGKNLDEITEVPGYSFESTTSENYDNARRYFLNLFHQLLVSVKVQKFTAQSSVDWKKMVMAADDYEKSVRKQQVEANPATAVRERIN